jgi:hypothetical protein
VRNLFELALKLALLNYVSNSFFSQVRNLFELALKLALLNYVSNSFFGQCSTQNRNKYQCMHTSCRYNVYTVRNRCKHDCMHVTSFDLTLHKYILYVHILFVIGMQKSTRKQVYCTEGSLSEYGKTLLLLQHLQVAAL